MNHLIKFRDLKIGDKFKFTGSGFSSVCTKISARKYTWHAGSEKVLTSRVGTVAVSVIKQ